MKKFIFLLLLIIFPSFIYGNSQDFTLNKGWNLVGTYLNNVNVEQFNNSNILTIWKWNNSSWEVWSPDSKTLSIIKSYNIETFQQLYSGEGFWINTKDNLFISIKGNSPDYYLMEFKVGWNLKSLKVVYPVDVNNDNFIGTIWKWTNNSWSVWSSNNDIMNILKNYNINSFDKIYPGEGFWIKVDTNFNPHFPPNFKFVAVDPYIQGATFFEDKNRNGIFDEGEQVSTPSNENGEFFFQQPPSPNSIIVMLNPGVENGEIYEGLLKTKIDNDTCDGKICIVSPLTTLLANGMTKDQIIEIFKKVGIELSPDDFKKDPIKILKFKKLENIQNTTIIKLQATMALNGFLNVLKALGKKGFYMTYEDFDNDTINNYLKPFVELTKLAISPNLLKDIKKLFPPNIPFPPITGELIVKTANSFMHFIVKDAVKKILSGEQIDFQVYKDFVKTTAISLAKKYFALLNIKNLAVLQWIKQNNDLKDLINFNSKASLIFKDFKTIVPFIFAKKTYPFTKDLLNNSVFFVMNKEDLGILKFYDNNTVEYHFYCLTCNKQDEDKIEDGFANWKINEFGNLIIEDEDEVDNITILGKGINFIYVQISFTENGKTQIEREIWRRTKKIKDFNAPIIYFKTFDGSRSGRALYNPIDNISGKQTGKHFIFGDKVLAFTWKINNKTGELIRHYINGNNLEAYLLFKSPHLMSFVTKISDKNNKTLLISPVLLKVNIFTKTFTNDLIFNKTFIIETYSRDENGKIDVDYEAVNFYDNNTFKAISKEDDKIEENSGKFKIENGFIVEEDGSWHRLIGEGKCKCSDYKGNDRLIVDNHYVDEDYLRTISVESWIPAKSFPENITGEYSIGENGKETVIIDDNGTAIHIDEDGNKSEFSYTFSPDRKVLIAKDENGNPFIKFYLLNFETDENTGNLKSLNVVGFDFHDNDVFSDTWIKK